ncbi:hypothetical protein BDW69DRAFT_164471 [Aspergillus filifer]
MAFLRRKWVARIETMSDPRDSSFSTSRKRSKNSSRAKGRRKTSEIRQFCRMPYKYDRYCSPEIPLFRKEPTTAFYLYCNHLSPSTTLHALMPWLISGHYT